MQARKRSITRRCPGITCRERLHSSMPADITNAFNGQSTLSVKTDLDGLPITWTFLSMAFLSVPARHPSRWPVFSRFPLGARHSGASFAGCTTRPNSSRTQFIPSPVTDMVFGVRLLGSLAPQPKGLGAQALHVCRRGLIRFRVLSLTPKKRGISSHTCVLPIRLTLTSLWSSSRPYTSQRGVGYVVCHCRA
jgi:hypothetical protein